MDAATDNFVTPVCYLCGTEIFGTPSRDHTVPSTLITRAQPKAKGYDYGGMLPTHPECNNGFGPEAYVSKSLDVLNALGDPEFIQELEHGSDPSIQIMAVNAGLLPHFTEGDRRFFRMIDVRDVDQAVWSAPEFFQGKDKTNLIRKALFASLSVLAKSTAALLHKRHGVSIPKRWMIYAFPYTCADPSLTFDDIFGPSKPFDEGLNHWISGVDDNNYFVIYKARGAVVYFLFAFLDTPVIAAVRSRFPEADHLRLPRFPVPLDS